MIVEGVRLKGFDVLPADDLAELRSELPIQPGAALTDETEQAAGNAAVEALQNHGYPYAQVQIAREPVDQNRTRLLASVDFAPKARPRERKN